MKRKSLKCSTGHGTGVLQEASLRTRLERRQKRMRLGAVQSEAEQLHREAQARCKSPEAKRNYFKNHAGESR